MVMVGHEKTRTILTCGDSSWLVAASGSTSVIPAFLTEFKLPRGCRRHVDFNRLDP